MGKYSRSYTTLAALYILILGIPPPLLVVTNLLPTADNPRNALISKVTFCSVDLSNCFIQRNTNRQVSTRGHMQEH